MRLVRRKNKRMTKMPWPVVPIKFCEHLKGKKPSEITTPMLRRLSCGGMMHHCAARAVEAMIAAAKADGVGSVSGGAGIVVGGGSTVAGGCTGGGDGGSVVVVVAGTVEVVVVEVVVVDA